MPEVLPDAVRPERLTDVLRRSGVLGAARVRDVEVMHARPTILSQITRLRLVYDGAATDAPISVILKSAHPERAARGWAGGRQEVRFYSQVAAAMPARLAPLCFDAHADEGTSSWHLLLEDLTEFA